MLFPSKPDIPPLNMNLDFLPEQTCSKHYEAITDEGHHIELRFSGGWITVWLQKSDEETSTTIIKSKFISPLGYMELHPKQICYILGLTLKGKNVPHPPPEELPERCFNYGDNKLHWEQKFLTDHKNDIGEFVDIIKQSFPDAILLQRDYNHNKNTCRVRQIPFMMDDDHSVQICIGGKSYDKAILEKEYTNYPFYISIYKDHVHPHNTNPNGIGYLKQQLERHPKRKNKLTLNWNTPGSYIIKTMIDNDDEYAKVCLEKMFAICQDYFYNIFDAYNLETKEKITTQHEYQLKWISHNYYEWLQREADRYSHFTIEGLTYIGFKPTGQKTIPTKIISSVD